MFQTLASRFADTMNALHAGERRDAVACTVNETGGQHPFALTKRCALEIQLHGVLAAGWNEDDAITNWIDTALPPPKGIRVTD